MIELNVKVPATSPASYTIFISRGLLSEAFERTRQLLPGRNVFVVTDSSLAACGHLGTLMGGRNVPSFVIEPAGEASKNMATVKCILEAMEAASLGRDTVIIALGGGTVGDMAGFAAAIFKRGVPVVHIPTTTVAQADSAIGGKTGVDSTLSKNAFGAFHHPVAVFVDVETLRTLDRRQYIAGLAESVKHGLIADAAYFEYIEKNADAILARDMESLEYMAAANARIKAAVVEQDPGEANLRKILNYGHTIGHAVESASRFSLLHGEAVAIGIVAAGLIEKKLGLADEARLMRIKTLLQKLGLPAALPRTVNADEIYNLLKLDKKSLQGRPRFVLLEAIGRMHCPEGQWAVEVPQEIIAAAISNLH